MIVWVRYTTNEKDWHSNSVYSPVYQWGFVKALKILRSPCGRGKAATRYHYSVIAEAPSDAGNAHNGTITAHIHRKFNKNFDPKKLNFEGNVALVYD